MRTFLAYDIDAVKYFIAHGSLTGTQKFAVHNFVRKLKLNNLWNKFVGIYVFIGGTAATHAINLKDTTQYNITWVGGVTHSSNGIQGNATTGYGNTNIPNNSLPTDSIHLSVYSRTTGQNGFDMGGDLTPRTQLVLNYNSGAFQGDTLFGLNEGASNATRITPAITTVTGLFQSTRVDANTTTIYKRGVLAGSNNTGSSTPGADPITICRILGGGTLSNRIYSYSSVGTTMTGAEALIHSDLVQEMQIILGRNIY